MALKSHSTRDEALTENEARINTNKNIFPLDTCSLFSGKQPQNLKSIGKYRNIKE
jgi:hypothetical protein